MDSITTSQDGASYQYPTTVHRLHITTATLKIPRGASAQVWCCCFLFSHSFFPPRPPGHIFCCCFTWGVEPMGQSLYLWILLPPFSSLQLRLLFIPNAVLACEGAANKYCCWPAQAKSSYTPTPRGASKTKYCDRPAHAQRSYKLAPKAPPKNIAGKPKPNEAVHSRGRRRQKILLLVSRGQMKL